MNDQHHDIEDDEDEVITYTVDHDANTHNTSLKMQGVKVPFAKMVELFGEPERAPEGERFRVHWTLSFSDGEVLSAYDWNEDVPVNQVERWNVSAHSFTTAYRFQEIVSGQPISNW